MIPVFLIGLYEVKNNKLESRCKTKARCGHLECLFTKKNSSNHIKEISPRGSCETSSRHENLTSYFGNKFE